MTGRCCPGGAATRRLTRRLSTITAPMLPAAALVFLPKCPLCLAAWLTVATGVSFSALGATWVRGIILLLIVVLCIASIAPVIWRRLGRAAAINQNAG